jgi:hypothetical protein
MRPRAAPLLLFILVLVASGCGDVRQPGHDAAPEVDAAPSASSPPGAVVLSAGGTVQSTSYRLDVQIGEALLPRPVAAGDTTLAPHGAIHP